MSNIHTLTETEAIEIPKRKFFEMALNNEAKAEEHRKEKLALEGRIKMNEDKMKVMMMSLNKLKEENIQLKNKVKSTSSKRIDNSEIDNIIKKGRDSMKYYEEHKEELIEKYIKEHHAGELEAFKKQLDNFLISSNSINNNGGHKLGSNN